MYLLKQKRILIFVAGMLALTACNKKDKDLILAEGQVLDAITAKPIPGATIEIRSEEMAFCIVCFRYDRYKTIESERKANDDGRFGFTYEGREKTYYALGGRSETHFLHQDSSFVKLQKGKNNRDLRLLLNPYAWLKLDIQNKAPIDTANISVQRIINFNGFYLKGFSGDTAVFIKTKFSGKALLEYGYEKESLTVYGKDSVDFIPGDTTNFRIEY
jgi:hypothetical protein